MAKSWEAQYGTLDVALASDDAMVVATDSRRTDTRDGTTTDDVRKLFLLPHNRVAAIAGLANASLPAFPGLTAQIPALLEQSIGRQAEFDAYWWEDPPPPAEWDEDIRLHWNASPYMWLEVIQGPLQTIYNIAATFDGPLDLNRATLMVLIAGFKQSGAVKIDRRLLVPREGRSSWGRRVIGVAEASHIQYSDRGFSSATIGKTELADALLAGNVPADFGAELRCFPGIEAYLQKLAAGEAGSMVAAELTQLAHDLIRATAARDRTVGAEPLQTAVLRRGRPPEYDQPVESAGRIVLPADGTWHMGVVFTSDYPFSDLRNLVMTDCVVSGSRSPIPLGGAFIFGSRFTDAIFRYESGPITFGENNELQNCTLRVAASAPREAWGPLRRFFSRVEFE